MMRRVSRAGAQEVDKASEYHYFASKSAGDAECRRSSPRSGRLIIDMGGYADSATVGRPGGDGMMTRKPPSHAASQKGAR